MKSCKPLSNEIKADSLMINSVEGFELAKAKQTIEQFVYSCSHALRAPLKSISGIVYLLNNAEQNKDIDPKFCLESIEKTVNKMECLLNEFEQFLSNSRLDLSSKPVDVKNELDKILGENKNAITSRKINVVLDIKQPVHFFTDENRFQVLLGHLISNAIIFHDDAKKDKRINIDVTVTPDRCVMEVSDNGVGIKDELKSDIFQLFFRGSEQSKGTGVGLYIVKEILNKMNGTITVYSEFSKGSTFLVTIPNLC